jgi:hypothetical protein
MRERAVVDTSRWDSWQRDYRFGVILVMPPPHVASPIDALRQTYDQKSHAICSAHISVSDPLCRELSNDAREEIQKLLSAVQPFEAHYDRPTASTRRPGVACPVAPQERFDELKRVIHQASVFDGAAYSRREIPAHMTIAEFLTIEDSLRICAELADAAPHGSFWCDRLEYVVPDASFRFQHRETFLLGAAGGGDQSEQ